VSVESDDGIRVTSLIEVAPSEAFRMFTEEVDAWWLHGPRFRAGGERKSSMRFEPGLGGRLLEEYRDAEGGNFELGRITVWEPGRRLVFEMRGRDFGPGQWTEVEIVFSAEGAATRVSLEHRGWAQFAQDHPVRHGLRGSAFVDMMSVFWADLLSAQARYARDAKQ